MTSGRLSNDAIIPLSREQPTRGHRQLPSSGYPNDIDVVVLHAVFDERVECTVNELFYDVFVEAAGNDGDPASGAVGSSGKFRHSGREQVAELGALCLEVA